MDVFIKVSLIFLLFGGGLGLTFAFFRSRSRPFVTGVAPPGPFSRQNRKHPKIGDYTIMAEAGRGGMGTVFKGVGRQGQTVAIKFIGGMSLDRRAGARGRNRVALVHEARLAASLRHPNIVRVFDVGRQGQTLYVVMEYLEGLPLSHYIRNQTVGILEALRIVTEVCDALSYAHERRIIHRDIKPANVFVTTDTVVKVLDFGLALQADDRPGFAGTPPYMSPEQITGGDVDIRSDIWSAGVTLFEILTGGCPFVADNLLALRMKIADATLPELPLDVPYVLKLKAVLEKALAKEREERYQTAADFAVDLRSLIREIQLADLNSSFAASPSGVNDQVSSQARTHSPKQFIPAPKSLVNLGFDGNTHARVFLIRPKQQKWFDAYNISTSHALGGLVAGVALTLLSTGLGGLTLFWQLSVSLLLRAIFLAILAALFALVALGVLVRLIYESIFPPQVLRCRSCQRRMRTASDWRRSVWSFDTQGLCVADCVTALQQDHWEDAVTLFLLHTTSESTDARYRFMFQECRFCRDQRAYFWFSPRSPQWSVGPEANWFEAYKFFDSRKAEEFAKNEQLRAGLTPPPSSKNADQFHGQRTI